MKQDLESLWAREQSQHEGAKRAAWAAAKPLMRDPRAWLEQFAEAFAWCVKCYLFWIVVACALMPVFKLQLASALATCVFLVWLPLHGVTLFTSPFSRAWNGAYAASRGFR